MSNIAPEVEDPEVKERAERPIANQNNKRSGYEQNYGR
jgi:hypothetical protein